MNKVCTVLVGLPASGKSTRVKDMSDIDPGVFVYSTDAFIESAAKHFGSTYDEMFSENIKAATASMNEMLDIAMGSGKNVIWDQTNLSLKKRTSIMNRMQSAGYEVECACFMPPETPEDVSVWEKRLNGRPGKTIPRYIIDSMQESFEKPVISEGFSKITFWDIYGEMLEELNIRRLV
jgi:predicted kinase